MTLFIIKHAQIPVAKEPVCLTRTDGKRPNGATLITWSCNKQLAWEVTVPDTFAESHLQETYNLAGAAKNRAAELKRTKYTAVTSTHIFAPIAIETSGTWNDGAVETVQELG